MQINLPAAIPQSGRQPILDFIHGNGNLVKRTIKRALYRAFFYIKVINDPPRDIINIYKIMLHFIEKTPYTIILVKN